jgi:thiamine transporter
MSKSVRLTESAVMVALAFVLSMMKIIPMPFGGSVTAFSMLPLVVIAYRHKIVWGLLTCFAYSLTELIMGMKNLTYGTSAGAVAAIIIVDYILAFTVIGFSGIFRGKFNNQGTSLAVGAFVACALRYTCHVVVGCTIWAGISIPSSESLLFSMAYNAAYMVPETLLLVVGAYFAGSAFNLTEDAIKRIPMEKASLTSLYASIPATISTVIAFALMFSMVQSEEGFDIKLITSADIFQWLPVITVFAVGVTVSAIIWIMSNKSNSNFD